MDVENNVQPEVLPLGVDIKKEPEVEIKKEPEVEIKKESEVEIKKEKEDKMITETDDEIKKETEDEIKKETEDEIKKEDEIEKETTDPYSYTQRDFTTELYKIELGNLPKYIGFGQLRKFLNGKMKLDTRKVKAIGNPPHHAFVTFKNEEDRDKALNSLNGYLWKKKNLIAKLANPAADPYVAKRKAGDSEESIPNKKARTEEDTDVSTILKNAVTPFWNIPYEEQLKKKEGQVHTFLQRLAKQIQTVNKSFQTLLKENSKDGRFQCCPMEPIKPSPCTTRYRNKCEFSVGRDLLSKLPTVGFRLNSYKEGSMSVSAPDDCINISEAMLKAVKSFQHYVRQSDRDVFNPETHAGYWRQLTVRTSKNNDVLIIIVMHPQILTEEEIQKEKGSLKKYFENGEGSTCGITSVYFQLFDKRHAGEEQSNLSHLLGRTDMTDTLCGMNFQVSAEAFFQINTSAAEVLYDTVADKVGITENSTVLDICCGTGTIGLILAKKGAKVIGIEMCSQAIDNARVNAECNGITTADFVCGRAEDVMPTALKMSGSSKVVAVANPPRAGLHPKVLKIIRATENIERLIYISCNPKAAFTNFVDLCRPTSNNYRGLPFYPVQVSPVDMFPHTPHYELVLVFERQNCT